MTPRYQLMATQLKSNGLLHPRQQTRIASSQARLSERIFVVTHVLEGSSTHLGLSDLRPGGKGRLAGTPSRRLPGSSQTSATTPPWRG